MEENYVYHLYRCFHLYLIEKKAEYYEAHTLLFSHDGAFLFLTILLCSGPLE